jgi:hypothetical protein
MWDWVGQALEYCWSGAATPRSGRVLAANQTHMDDSLSWSVVICRATMQRRYCALALGVALVARGLQAQVGSAGGTRLSFVRAENATECIAAPDIEREVTRRMGRDPFAGPARQWIEGTVELRGAYYEVQLYERNADGRTLGMRRLREAAIDCHKLDDAVVLAIALIIDPTARLAPALPVANTGGTMRSAPSLTADDVTHRLNDDRTAGAAAQAARPTDAAGRVRRPNAASPRGVRHDAPTPTGISARSPAAFVTADAVVVSGILPGVAAGAELVTRLPLDAQRRMALRLSALFLPEKRPHPGGGDDLGYGLTALEVGACAGTPGDRVAWYGCSALGVGAIHAVVHNPAPYEPGDRLWMAMRFEAGLLLRVAGPVWVETRLFDLLAPRRWEFRVKIDDKREPVFVQSLFMPGAALGLGLHFD